MPVASWEGLVGAVGRWGVRSAVRVRVDVDVDVEMPAGRGKNLVVELPAGNYNFYCSVLGHESMTGVLTVGP